jgi:hypothetical protein
MIMRTKLKVSVAIGALFMLATPAFAADPPDAKTIADRRAALQQRNERDLKAFEDARAALKNQPPPFFIKREKVSNEVRETDVRIEKYIDGAILYSYPYDAAREKELFAFGSFRKVKSKDEISDKTVYDGRIYRVMRTLGTAQSEWEAAIGREVTIKVKSLGYGGPAAIGLRVKR